MRYFAPVTFPKIAAAVLTAAFFVLGAAAVAFGQEVSPSPAPPSSAWDNLPGGVLLLLPIAIGGAAYVSRRLAGPPDAEQQPRRVGAVSRALSRDTSGEEAT